MIPDRRLLQEAWGARLQLGLTIILGGLGGLVVVLQAVVISRIVAGVFLSGQTLDDVQSDLVRLLVLGLARAALAWGSEVTAHAAAARVKHALRQRLTRKLFTLGPAYLRGERSGELSNTIVEGTEALEAYFGQYLPQLAVAALVPITILAFIFPLDPISALVLLLTAPLIPLFMILIGDVAGRLTRRQWTSLSRLSAHFLDVLQGLTTLKLLGASRAQTQTIARIDDQFRKTTLSVLRVAFLSALVLELVATISTAVVAVEVGLRLLYGRLAFGQAFSVLLLAPEFYLPLRLVGARFHSGMTGIEAAKRIFQVLDLPAQPCLPSRPGLCMADLRMDIRFEDVHFAYDDGERDALRGLTLRIPAGQKIAVIGPSGAGKTTLAHLLLRFIRPDKGLILVNGIEMEHLDPTSWRTQVAWVPQNPYLFNASVEENLRLARPQAPREDVVAAAELAHAHEFIQALPQGYDTIVGERGARLSAGQAQRLALARAFLKDAPFLILDEATAHLDPETQSQIQVALARLMEGRTALIVAHRLGTVRVADSVLVMCGGRIIEAGTHEGLMAAGGLYQRMITANGGRR